MILICVYFEYGFSMVDSVRYCFRVCCKSEKYKMYIKGKLIYHKRELNKEFEKELNELKSITKSYSEDIKK